MSATMQVESPLEQKVQKKSSKFLMRERELLERFMPGLDAALQEIPLEMLEGRDNPSIAMLKEAKGPALLIPEEFGGMGASAAQGMKVLRAVASRAPSLGIAFTMHNFSVATLVEWAVFGE